MPWKPKDATQHTHSADTAKKKKVWSQVANQALRDFQTGRRTPQMNSKEGSAIAIANHAVSQMKD